MCAGMWSAWLDAGASARELARGGGRERCMFGIVVVVQQVVQRAGMLGMRSQHPVEDRRDPGLRLAARQRLAVALVRVGRIR